MRIAWIGDVRDGGGVPGMGALLLEGLLQQGVEVELFTHDDPASLPQRFATEPRLKVSRVDSKWSWGRWYSRKPFRAFVSSTIARTLAHGRLCDLVIQRHQEQPFDCIFQLSQMELFKLGRHLSELPPVVVYPCAHAAGELRWHRRESAYALQSERRRMHYAVRLFLIYRSYVQRRELKKPALILGPSFRFNELISQDYGVDPARMGVLRHPILIENRPAPASRAADGKIHLLFVARISVRKGVEQVIELSHRLGDLAGKVEIQVIGDSTQWSDYTAHLKELNPATARYFGSLPYQKMDEAYQAADALLVPSMYEPGSLAVGEGLSKGLVIIASDEVGPTEVLSSTCCRVFPAGDVAALEACVRDLVAELATDRTRFRAEAIEQAKIQFAPARIAGELREFLQSLAMNVRPTASAVK